MSVILAFLIGVISGMIFSAFAIVADDETDMVYKEGYFEGYEDGKRARTDDDSSGDKKEL